MIYVLNGSFWFPLETEWLRSKSGSREGGGCIGGYTLLIILYMLFEAW